MSRGCQKLSRELSLRISIYNSIWVLHTFLRSIKLPPAPCTRCHGHTKHTITCLLITQTSPNASSIKISRDIIISFASASFAGVRVRSGSLRIYWIIKIWMMKWADIFIVSFSLIQFQSRNAAICCGFMSWGGVSNILLLVSLCVGSTNLSLHGIDGCLIFNKESLWGFQIFFSWGFLKILSVNLTTMRFLWEDFAKFNKTRLTPSTKSLWIWKLLELKSCRVNSQLDWIPNFKSLKTFTEHCKPSKMFFGPKSPKRNNQI